MMQVSVGVHKRRNLVARSSGSPAIVDALACQRQVKSEVRIWMRFCIVRYLWKPWTRHHETGRIDSASFQSFDAGGVYGVSYPEVVRVNNQELCITRITEFFLQSLFLRLCGETKSGTKGA